MPENISADDARPGADPVDSAETGASEGATPDFDIDLGTYTAREDDVDINLNFGGDTDTATEEEDDVDLDFGAPPTAAETDEPEESDEEDAESDAGQTALESFRTELHSKPGDWYVVHTYSGMENRVLQNLENRVSSLNMEDYIYEIIVPTEEVTEIRNGQRK
ncbi:MAG TPA: transcription termination/antitermination NusG family protein, partial [Propionibacteriaceae bacterium]|nr:transcription termination/antitermination NusG family protein [Propionibacteriaceae bacterium]